LGSTRVLEVAVRDLHIDPREIRGVTTSQTLTRITLALCSLDSSCIRPDAFEERPNERRETPTRICTDRESSYRNPVSYAEESRIACHPCFFASLNLPRFTSSVCFSTERGAPLHLVPTVPGPARCWRAESAGPRTNVAPVAIRGGPTASCPVHRYGFHLSVWS
jgi:hypothetical protein